MRVVEASDARGKDYVIWDDDLAGFGLRVFGFRKAELHHPVSNEGPLTSLHNWASWRLASETARREAKVQLGRAAGSDGLRRRAPTHPYGALRLRMYASNHCSP